MAEVQIAARVSQDEKDELVRFCKENDENISRVIRKAVREYLAKNQQKQDTE